MQKIKDHNEVAKELGRRIREVLSNNEGYQSVFEALPSFGAFYEFNVEDQGNRFYLYLRDNKYSLILEKNQVARQRFYEQFIKYSNSSKEYLCWIEGKVNSREIKWEGSMQAHTCLNEILSRWRHLFLSKEQYKAYVEHKIANMQYRL